MPADGDKVSNLVANSPVAPTQVRRDLEDKIKMELLADLSLEDVRNLVKLIKSGGKLPVGQEEYPDEFDEFGRNFRRMVHRMEMVGANGYSYFDERPMAMSLKEARGMKPPGDFFDIDEKVWILRGIKRQRDYVENTVGYMQSGKGEPHARV